MPDLGQVPEIDVPYYLPDLPGVADDLMYSADLGPGIAPSAPGGPIPELPTFSTELVEPSKAGMGKLTISRHSVKELGGPKLISTFLDSS